MPLFQNTVITKYLKTQNKTSITEKWQAYKTHFLNPTIQQNIRNAKEEQYQEGFLRDLFVKILGYTLNPDHNYNLTTELKNVKDAKKADGGIIINNNVFGVIELKGTNTTDLAKVEAQAFGYKNNQPECVYVITSNFEKLRFYIDNAIEHIAFNLFTLTEQEFEMLYLCLAFENIKAHIPKKLKAESLSQEEHITKQLYKDYSLFKRELFQDLTKQNPQFEALELFKKSQKLLDRFLFLFFAEDRNLLPPNSVRLILKQWKQLNELDAYTPLYDRFKKYFGYLNTGFKGKQYNVFAYNGGLFKPDKVLANIKIDDELLYKHTLKLADYDFASEVDVNILGHIFENSLNELDEVKAQLEGQTVDKTKTKRKKDGVFYTPKYITKYIVENTIGKLCNQQKDHLAIVEDQYTTDKKRQKKTIKVLADKLKTYRKWLLELTICDPACGSGAFLNEALNFLIAEHSYVDELQAKLFGDALVLSDVENSILEHNLFGVDLNEESVEIAKLSLWLRTAQPNRKLNSLNNNIKCGNSLIDDTTVAGNKAFHWQTEFPTVFKEKHTKAYHITTAIHDSRTSKRMVKYKVRERRDMGTNPYPNVIYFTPEDDLLITQTIANIVKEDQLNLLAYNICADHIHLVLVCELEKIPSIMQKIKAITAKKVNNTREYAPLRENNTNTNAHAPLRKPLWQQKYSAPKEITSQEQLENTLNYVESNRAKHELPAHPKTTQTIINNMCSSADDAFKPQYSGGFDVVIGNPPYVLMQPSNTPENILTYYKTYQVASYKIDLFHLFFEMSINILKTKGKLGFITPNTYLNNKYIKPLRLFILNNTFINSLVNYKDPIFADAGVDVATVILTKENSSNNEIETFEVERSHSTFLGNKQQIKWLEDKENIFNLNKSFDVQFNGCVALKDVCSSYFGIQAYDRKSSISDTKENEDYLPLIDGGDINEFSFAIPSKYFNFLPEKIKSGGNINIYNKKRIVISQIGLTPIVGLCDSTILASNTLYNINLVDDSYSLNYLLSILTSKLLKSYWISKYSDGKKLFPKIKGFQLKELPIKIADKQTQQPFIEKADQMLTLNKELQDVSAKFIRTLQRKFFTTEHAPLPKKLQKWYELTFADFIKELKKKKIKLSLAEEAEWEDYFLAEQQKALAIKTQIDQTDKKIDTMVYELYGLTVEEIQIVEQS